MMARTGVRVKRRPPSHAVALWVSTSGAIADASRHGAAHADGARRPRRDRLVNAFRHAPALPALRRRGALAPLAMAAFLAPWTVGLAATLPAGYSTAHWNVAWAGFDAALAALAALTARAAWRRSRAEAPLLVALAALLSCDAWFDVTTSLGTADGRVALLEAAFAELPLALAFALRARRLLAATRASR